MRYSLINAARTIAQVSSLMTVDTRGSSTNMSVNQLIFSQISEKDNEFRRAHSVALTAAGCGDGSCGGFGVFTVTQGSLDGKNDEANTEAALMVAQVIATEMLQNFYYKSLFDAMDVPPVNEVLQNALNTANQRIKSKGKGGLSSATTIVINDNRLYLMRVGVGCAFLLTKDGIQRLTSESSAQQNSNQLVGSTDTLQPEDITIKYLPSYSSIFITNADVWDTTEIENAILHAPSLSQAGETLLEHAPASVRPDIAGLLIRVGLVQG